MLRFRLQLLSVIVAWGNRTLVAWMHKRAERVVFISESVKEFFVSMNGGIEAKARLIENGVDLQTFKHLEESERFRLRSKMSFRDCPVVLFAGRFVEKKGLDTIRRLAERRPNWSWLLVGAGPIDPLDWKLPQISVLGRKSHEELAALYQASDLLIVPSTGEGFPLVVQEAMACGLSVLV
ncbi:MAG: glycosyltransferase, partial [Flavobacterium sp.]